MRNWKTSLSGLLLAILVAIQPLAETGDFDFKRDFLRYLIAIGIAAFGFLSKDHDVTGTK
jgi:hypothetical protein